MYYEIRDLYDYCIEIGVSCELRRFLDGYSIIFANNADAVQHSCSYGSRSGCVEFAETGYEEVDYVSTPIERAKKFVLEHKEELNKEGV